MIWNVKGQNITKNYGSLHAVPCAFSYPRFPKFLMVPMNDMECKGTEHKLKSLHAVPWACMQFKRLSCSSMSLHTVSKTCIQFHELACSSISLQLAWSAISLHAVSYACKQFHEFACNSLKISISLSSSQELRSACLFLGQCEDKSKVCPPLRVLDTCLNISCPVDKYFCNPKVILKLFE